MIELIAKALYEHRPTNYRTYLTTPEGGYEWKSHTWEEAIQLDPMYVEECRKQASAVIQALSDAKWGFIQLPDAYWGPNPSKNGKV
jgi:hypothetical protein